MIEEAKQKLDKLLNDPEANQQEIGTGETCPKEIKLFV